MHSARLADWPVRGIGDTGGERKNGLQEYSNLIVGKGNISDRSATQKSILRLSGVNLELAVYSGVFVVLWRGWEEEE